MEAHFKTFLYYTIIIIISVIFENSIIIITIIEGIIILFKIVNFWKRIFIIINHFCLFDLDLSELVNEPRLL